MHKNKVVGLEGENLALIYLKRNGLSLIKENFCSRFGEIDLIMRDKKDIVFVEVKKRNSGMAKALESITWHKQQKLVKAAQFYLVKLGYDVPCRFDAVVIDGENQINWLKNIIVL